MVASVYRGYSQALPREEIMQQWEYLYATILAQTDNRIQKVFINGQVKDYPRGKGPTLHEYHATLSREGWEKISSFGGRTHIFRRLRPEDQV